MTDDENKTEDMPAPEENTATQEAPEEVRQPKPVTINDIELENLQQEAKEYKDKYLRLLADQENTRKRLIKEKEELTEYAVQNVVLEFLQPIDHLEQALAYTDKMSNEVRHWCEGFKMILSQFKDLLSNHGVDEFHAHGVPFDPHHHEAIEMVEKEDVAPGTVIAEMRKGYKMGKRTIRPARVKVSKHPEKKVNNVEENQQ